MLMDRPQGRTTKAIHWWLLCCGCRGWIRRQASVRTTGWRGVVAQLHRCSWIGGLPNTRESHFMAVMAKLAGNSPELRPTPPTLEFSTLYISRAHLTFPVHHLEVSPLISQTPPHLCLCTIFVILFSAFNAVHYKKLYGACGAHARPLVSDTIRLCVPYDDSKFWTLTLKISSLPNFNFELYKVHEHWYGGGTCPSVEML